MKLKAKIQNLDRVWRKIYVYRSESQASKQANGIQLKESNGLLMHGFCFPVFFFLFKLE